MNPINKQLSNTIETLFGKKALHEMVEKEWQKKARCLENLTNKNKDELKTLELNLLKGLKYRGIETSELYEILRQSKDITPEQKAFAYFLFNNYTKHSLKAQGFN